MNKPLYLQVYPSNLVSASRMGKMGRSLQRSGLFGETHLVGVQPGGLPDVEELADGVRVVRVRGVDRPGNLGRVLRVLTWHPRVFLRYRKQPVAVVAAHNVWVLPMCHLLSRRTGAALVYNAHELETETLTMRGPKRWVAKFIERRIIRHCGLVSVVNEPIADWYESTYGIPRPVAIGNVPVVADASTTLRRDLGIAPEEMLYVHTGFLAGGRNIPLILDAFSGSSHHVAFLGDGPYKEAVLAAGRRHPNIHWVAPVEPDVLVAHVKEADVALCLIELDGSLSLRLSSPNKLFEALAAGVPALCSDLPHARQLLGDGADRWLLANPTTELADAIECVSKGDCEDFRRAWTGLGTWEDEVAPLVSAMARMLGLKTGEVPDSAYHVGCAERDQITGTVRPDLEEE